MLSLLFFLFFSKAPFVPKGPPFEFHFFFVCHEKRETFKAFLTHSHGGGFRELSLTPVASVEAGVYTFRKLLLLLSL